MSKKLDKQSRECLNETDLNDFSKEDAFEIGFQSGYLIAVDEIIDLLYEELAERIYDGDYDYGDTEIYWRDWDNLKNPDIKDTFFSLLKKKLGIK